MTTSHYSPFLLLGITLSLSGCAETAEVPPPLADARAELTTADAAYYVITRRDDRALYAARVGAAKTTCPDHVDRPACEVSTIDLSRADLAVDDEDLAYARLAEGRAVVRAKLVTGGLVVSEVWTRTCASAGQAEARASTDAMFLLRDVREGGDAWLRAEPVGGGAATHYKVLDLGLVGGGLSAPERVALGRGALLASGVAIGSAFVVGSVFTPFPAPHVDEPPPPVDDADPL
jgi:hypothetical protein